MLTVILAIYGSIAVAQFIYYQRLIWGDRMPYRFRLSASFRSIFWSLLWLPMLLDFRFRRS